MSKTIDWKDPATLTGLTPFQAMQVLAQIGAAFDTKDAAADRRFAAIIGSSPEAVEFANACNALGRKMRAAHDCRPGLRERAPEARETLDAKVKPRQTSQECAEEYASDMKAFHRK